MTIQQAFELALQHHRTGHLAEAEAIYRQILAADPRHADSLHLLGVIAHQAGRNNDAVDLIRRAIAIKPDFPEAQGNLGVAMYDNGQLDEAISAYREAIALKPDHAEAYCNLGNALRDKGQPEEAIAACRKAIALKPCFPEAHGNLGNALRENGQLDEAIAAYREAIALRPDFPEAHGNLGIALKDNGQADEAIAFCRTAIALAPGSPEAHSKLGNALRDNGRLNEAIAAFRQAIALKPDFPEAHGNLGGALGENGRFEEAIAACSRAITLRPDYPEAHANLGCALKGRGRLNDAVAAFRQAIALKPGFPEAHSNLLLTLNDQHGLDPRDVAEEHRCWARKQAEPLRQSIEPHRNDRSPDRRLRIGYVSPDFRSHSVAFFFENLLANHDRAQTEVFCYSDVSNPDMVTARIERHAGNWRKIAGRTDSQVAGLIRADGIDVLVDLAGHTAHNRLPVFARKPAPVQATWLGYPGTTGLSRMDYRVTDNHADPPGMTDHLHSEQLIRLPEIFACFRPADDSPPVGPLPASRRGHITFASFHPMARLNDRLLGWWASILDRVPGSRLMLVTSGLDEAASRQSFTKFFEEKGIGNGRLEFSGRRSLHDYLELHNEVDLLLDSHPWSGHTTACHALWMGVPVITLAGRTHCSRMVTSVLANVGLPEFVTETPESYVQAARELAADPPRLADLRSSLRQRMQASPLMDGPRFARRMEDAYREMWRKWCRRESSMNEL